ncbi:sulfurtransferase [Ascidiimonas sp. W6]|uniref:sulfurtransferase n=1 Tax=Ascidiimonas meishanensis TaxID=3128903 RepID=UPI0030ECA3F0
MQATANQHLVDTQWLSEHLNDTDLIILDATIGKTTTHTSANVCIPGAQFFDLKKDFCEPDAPFPSTVPTAKTFEKGCQKLGITAQSTLVIYDDKGIYSSPRAWWLFSIMGHPKVFVLDGGLPAWQAANYPVTNKYAAPKALGNFKAQLQLENIRFFKDIEENLLQKEFLLVDARSAGRFTNTEADPRPGLRSGHIPDSYNLPYTELLENGKFKSVEKLKKVFQPLLKEKRPLVFSCGSGITACVVLLASEGILPQPKSVFDGSWTEWATRVAAD